MPIAKIKPGKIVVNNDEWAVSDTGFENAPDAEIFAQNIANWFTGGRPGKFHVYSTNFSLTQTKLKDAMTRAGHTWTVDFNKEFDLETLLNFDGIFVGGDPKDNHLLIDYVKAGGNVYLVGGTRIGGTQADAEIEADSWNTFLNAFGFQFARQYNWIGGNQEINHPHPIFAGVKSLYQYNGNSIIQLDPNSKDSQILISHSSNGLFAVFDPTTGEFQVPSNSDVGVEFTNHQTKKLSYTFTPSGTWNLVDPTKYGKYELTAWGNPNLSDAGKPKDLKYPQNVAYALLAVSSKGAVTEMGDKTPKTIDLEPDETLTFLVNDNDFSDNVGELSVKWSYNLT